MKNFTFIFLLLFISTGYSQTVLPTDESGKVTFTAVNTAEGLSKSQLYNNAINFFESYYKSNKTLQKEDEAKGQFEGESFMGFDGIEGKVKYSIIITVKEGRYKYELSNFLHQNYTKGKCSGASLDSDEPQCSDGGKMSKKTWEEIKARTAEEAEALIASLTEAMQQKGAEKKTDDW